MPQPVILPRYQSPIVPLMYQMLANQALQGGRQEFLRKQALEEAQLQAQMRGYRETDYGHPSTGKIRPTEPDIKIGGKGYTAPKLKVVDIEGGGKVITWGGKPVATLAAPKAGKAPDKDVRTYIGPKGQVQTFDVNQTIPPPGWLPAKFHEQYGKRSSASTKDTRTTQKKNYDAIVSEYKSKHGKRWKSEFNKAFPEGFQSYMKWKSELGQYNMWKFLADQNNITMPDNQAMEFFKSADEVKQAVADGVIDTNLGIKILKEKFGYTD